MTEDTDNCPIFIDVSENCEQDLLKVLSGSEETSVKTESRSSDVPADGKVKKIRCNICCRYSAENEEKIMRHIRKVHRGENPFQCCMCDYTTYNKCTFEDHVRIHQGIKPFKCSECPYRSVSKKNAKKHELIHRVDNPLRCSDCPMIARNSRVLNHHRLKQHPIRRGPNNSVVCPECDSRFRDELHYSSHLKNRRNCPECKTMFCRKLLSGHISEVHGGVVTKKVKKVKLSLKCKVCKWASNSKLRFLLHLIHHPEQDISKYDLDLSILKKYGIIKEDG